MFLILILHILHNFSFIIFFLNQRMHRLSITVNYQIRKLKTINIYNWHSGFSYLNSYMYILLIVLNLKLKSKWVELQKWKIFLLKRNMKLFKLNRKECLLKRKVRKVRSLSILDKYNYKSSKFEESYRCSANWWSRFS